MLISYFRFFQTVALSGEAVGICLVSYLLWLFDTELHFFQMLLQVLVLRFAEWYVEQFVCCDNKCRRSVPHFSVKRHPQQGRDALTIPPRFPFLSTLCYPSSPLVEVSAVCPSRTTSVSLELEHPAERAAWNATASCVVIGDISGRLHFVTGDGAHLFSQPLAKPSRR